jgi:GcrA cell cycle regulator
MPSGTWTKQQDAALKAHIGAGLSYAAAAGEINLEFKTNYTRNAAVGRGLRLGMCNPAQKKKPGPKRRHPKPWDAQGISKRTWYRRRNAAPAAPKPAFRPRIDRAEIETLRCIEVVPLHLNLLELEPNQCRWPYGDGPFTFCGHPQLSGFVYCAPHVGLSVGPGTSSERNARYFTRAA